MNNFVVNKNKKYISYFLFFLIIDLLFLPNFIASTPLSFFLIIFLSFKLFSFNRSLIYAYVILIVFMIASVLNGMYVNSSGYEENVKRLIQMSLMLSLFFINLKGVDLEKIIKRINKICVVFIIFASLMCVLTVIFPDVYFKYISIVSPNSINATNDNVAVLRFSYIFSDPNTFGYLLVLIANFALLNFKNNRNAMLFWVLIFLLILTTQSRGALLALLFTLGIIAVYRYKINLKSLKLILFSVFLFTLILYLLMDYLIFFIEAFEKRSEIERSMGSNLGGGRYEKYLYFFNNMNISFYGSGYTLFIDNKLFRPHSDLIRFGLSYGLFFIFIFIYILYPKSFNSFIILVTGMFPFLINTLTDDYRLFGVFLLFYIICNYKR